MQYVLPVQRELTDKIDELNTDKVEEKSILYLVLSHFSKIVRFNSVRDLKRIF